MKLGLTPQHAEGLSCSHPCISIWGEAQRRFPALKAVTGAAVGQSPSVCDVLSSGDKKTESDKTERVQLTRRKPVL